MDYPDGAENKKFTLKEIDIKDNNKKKILKAYELTRSQSSFLSGYIKAFAEAKLRLLKRTIKEFTK